MNVKPMIARFFKVANACECVIPISKLPSSVEYIESHNPQWVKGKMEQLKRYHHEDDDEYDEYDEG